VSAAPERAGEEHHGVTLARFAAVRAALSEPFVLRRVLAVEELSEADWRAADIAWKKRLARGPDDLLSHYRRELAAAEDWLLRIVSPLHEDPEAWADFLSAFTLKPAEVLSHTQLGMNDVSRLLRFWADQSERDGSLADRIEARMKQGFVDLPVIHPEPRKLRRSRASYGADPPPAEPAPRPQSRAVTPPRRRDTLPPEPLPETPVSPPTPQVPSFMAAQAERPSMEPPVSHRPSQVPSFMAAQAERPSMEPPVSHPPSQVPSFMAAQAEATQADRVSTLPPPASPEAPPAPSFIAARSPARGATAAFVAPPQSPVLPFEKPPPRAEAPPPSIPPRASPSYLPPPPEPADMPLAQYASLCVEIGNHPDRTAETLARYRVTPEAKRAIDARWRERFLADPRLFSEFRRACDAYHAWLSQQAPVSRRSVPPPGPPSIGHSPHSSRPVHPFAAAPGPVSIPPLTIEQYAALTVDLELAPAHRAATLHHYRLTEAQATALDAFWRQRFPQDAAAHAAFERAAAAHRTWRMQGSR